jgi:hypothetical protein
VATACFACTQARGLSQQWWGSSEHISCTGQCNQAHRWTGYASSSTWLRFRAPAQALALETERVRGCTCACCCTVSQIACPISRHPGTHAISVLVFGRKCCMQHCRPLEDGNILWAASGDTWKSSIVALHSHPGGSHTRIKHCSLCPPACASQEGAQPNLGTSCSTWSPCFLRSWGAPLTIRHSRRHSSLGSCSGVADYCMAL